MGIFKKPSASTSAAPSAAAREAWRRWFNPGETPIEEALEVFRIDMEESENVGGVHRVKHGPFILRERQREALDIIQNYFWRKKKMAAQLVCLKCRRYGMSRLFVLLGLLQVLRIPGFQAMLVAQDDKMARKHFQVLRDTFCQIPPWVLAEMKIEVVKDTDNEIILRHAGFNTSEFCVAPAKRNALGRGARMNMLLLTELPQWPASAKRDLTGVLGGFREETPGNILIYESTANGYDLFHDQFQLGKQKNSGFKSIFVGSHERPENRLAFESPEAEDEFIKTIGTLRQYGIEDELILFRRLTVDLKWTPGEAARFLHWRRRRILTKCRGVISFFKREEPTTEAEAFAGTGLPIFDKAILESWRDAAQEREDAAYRCRLVLRGDKIETIDEISAELCIFERPIAGRRYCWGADVASGIQRLADNRTEADFSVVIVKDVATGITVARFRAQLPEGEFATAIFRIAVWYNGARGYIERAINGSGVTLDKFEDMEAGGFAGSNLLLSQRVLVKTDAASVRANYRYSPGFKTTSKTKPQLVDNIRVFIQATGIPDGAKPCPWDLFFIDEGQKFERVGTTGRMEASIGHDDVLMAEGMALEARARVLEDVTEEEKPYIPPTDGDSILLEYCRVVHGNRVEDEDDDPPGY